VAERTAKLEETVHSLETFSYTVAHNLRSPLRALEGMAHVLLEDYGPRLDFSGVDYLRRIRGAAVRIDSLIRDLVDYDRAARDRFHLSPVSLKNKIDEALACLQPQVKASGAKTEIEEPLPVVMANPT
jgi:light-regulated signal transduction histidine kinase (bacteriophytochrome)